MNRYLLIDKDTFKSEIKISRRTNIYLSDLKPILGLIIICFIFQSLVLPQLLVVYIICNAILGLILISPSKFNPGKKYWQSLFIYITSIHSFYKPLPYRRNEKVKERMLNDLEKEQN